MSFVLYAMVLALAMVAETVTWKAPNTTPLKEAELSRCRGTRDIITRFAAWYHVPTLVSRVNFLALELSDTAQLLWQAIHIVLSAPVRDCCECSPHCIHAHLQTECSQYSFRIRELWVAQLSLRPSRLAPCCCFSAASCERSATIRWEALHFPARRKPQ